MTDDLHIDDRRLAKLCVEYGVAKLSLFGSVLRDDFDLEHSDVDVLIEFAPGADRSLFAIVRLQDDLTALLGRPAHVSTPGGLSRYFRDEVLAEAEVRYVAA
jgi:predicted nucleotidyltransferase